MRTLADWINAHPEVDSSQFEKNYSKEGGSGDYEYTCGFCLASHFDGDEGPEGHRKGRATRRGRLREAIPAEGQPEHVGAASKGGEHQHELNIL